ncbi:hypothetical protein ACFFMM_14055 [Micromonospora chaiyaphumensis]|uniref:Uncharacterized protein n=1 Tax=Micromonospora chaiyaphumensis TaxID=307119 RepID=A0A1C4YCW9_9ACTN|nr:hypothetical protein [Micromonospora chaiyaphumensis]SCF18575.1 hypothetical protein GA0070214_10847 [Micromonospora chaiyaphumensis]
MGEQAVTGAGGAPAPERTPDSTGEDAAAAAGGATAPGPTSAGMTADGTPAAPADVSGAGMSADATPAAPAAAPPAPGSPERTSDITAGPGGVMTDEVGVVTGDLTLRTEYADGQVTLRVQYKDADEWYAVTGGRVPLADPAALDAVHTVAVALLNRPEG